MAICETCGKENRDKALFCLGCARPLAAFLPDSSAKTLENPEPDVGNIGISGGGGGAAESIGAQPSVVWRWVLLVAVAVVLLAFGLKPWKESLSQRGPAAGTPSEQVSTPGATTTQQAAPAPSMPKETFLDPGHTEVVLEERSKRPEEGEALKAVDERAAQSEKLVRTNAARAVQRQSAEEARQAAGRSDPAIADLVGASLALPVAAPKAEVSVEKTCSQATNFISRDLCRIEACKKTSKAGDPICVWYRKIEEDRKRLAN